MKLINKMEAAITSLFVILMLGFFPLFFQDGYFNIAEAKMMFFYFCGAGLTVLTVILAGTGYLQERKTGKTGKKTGHLNFRKLAIFRKYSGIVP